MTTPRIASPIAAACAAAALAGCAGDIRPADFGLTPPSDALTPTGPVTTGQNADGTLATLVDATSDAVWTYLDFDTRSATTPDGPWELRFLRFHVSVNGGVTGPGGVEVAPIAGRALDEVKTEPSAGWLTDAPDGDDPNLDPDYAFEQGDGWYAYNFDTHVLTPRKLVWALRSPAGATIKLQIESYYDPAGTPAWFLLRWLPL